MRALLSLWVVAVLWLVPAAGQRSAPGRDGRTISGADAGAVEAARLPARVETTLRGAPAIPIRGSGGSPVAGATAPSPVAHAHVTLVRGDALLGTARRIARPRRLSFPVEATAPPATIS